MMDEEMKQFWQPVGWNGADPTTTPTVDSFQPFGIPSTSGVSTDPTAFTVFPEFSATPLEFTSSEHHHQFGGISSIDPFSAFSFPTQSMAGGQESSPFSMNPFSRIEQSYYGDDFYSPSSSNLNTSSSMFNVSGVMAGGWEDTPSTAPQAPKKSQKKF